LSGKGEGEGKGYKGNIKNKIRENKKKIK